MKTKNRSFNNQVNKAPDRSTPNGGVKRGTFGAVGNALIVMAGIAMLMTFASPAVAATIHFGVRCQSDFQNGWLPTIDVYGECSNFISEIGPAGAVDFYFNLHGAQVAFYYGQGAETCDSCGGVDSVDFFYMSTHGGIANNDPNYAGYAMWNNNTLAWTPSMRFGSSGKQVKALATFSCDTFKNSDGLFWNRWKSAYSGGLKVGVGGHDLLYIGNDTQAGTEFAAYMRQNLSIGSSWLEAVYYANNSNHPTVANTGANSADCWNRQGVTLNNVMSESVLRDGAIGYACWSNWN
jgi:hypothetical protein